MVPVPADKTVQVFRSLAAQPLPPPAPESAVPSGFANRTALLAHMKSVGNDLYLPARAIVPQIDDIMGALYRESTCELAQLSGGGPTCFGIFPDMATAREASAAIASRNPRWWVRASRLC